MYIDNQKVIDIKDVENVLEQYTNIEEPIIVKRENKEDVIILSIDEYKKKIFLKELEQKLDQAEDEIARGQVRNSRDVFKDLRNQYGY